MRSDGFTRVGRTVLASLLAQEQSLQTSLADVPAAKRLDVLRHLLFVAEGSLCSPLISDVLSEALRSEAIACAGRTHARRGVGWRRTDRRSCFPPSTACANKSCLAREESLS